MLANKALLCSLNITQWHGRRLDRKATLTVKQSYLTQERVGNYTKKLLPGAKELDDITRIAGQIRVFFYEQSLPWFSDGTRILSAKNYMPFTQAFRAHKQAYVTAVQDFIAAYPQLVQQAQYKLGNLFNAGEYPTVASLQQAFSCDIQFMPMPDVGDFRVEVLDSEKDSFLAKIKEAETGAIKECWNRMYGVVSKAVARLAEPDAIFRDSLIKNIQETVDLLPRLNVMDDPALEQARRQLESMLSGISAEKCRTDTVARQDAAGKLEQAMQRMGAFV